MLLLLGFLLLLLLLLFYLWPRLEFNIYPDEGEIREKGEVIPAKRINLFVEYYIPSDVERRKEIDFTLNYNLTNPEINRIYTIVHSQEEMDSLPEGTYPILIDEKRPTFGQLFRIIREYTQGDEEVSILANTDIALDRSIGLSRKISKEEVYALTRYEVEHILLPLRGNFKYKYGTSQDTWIFRGKPDVSLELLDFKTGTLRCDNRIAYILREKYRISNPCLSIKTYHIHLSDIRSYTSRNVFLVHPLEYEKYNIVPGKGLFIPVSKLEY